MRLYRVQTMGDCDRWLSTWCSGEPGACVVCGRGRVFRNNVPGCMFSLEQTEREAADLRRVGTVFRVQFVREITEPTA